MSKATKAEHFTPPQLFELHDDQLDRVDRTFVTALKTNNLSARSLSHEARQKIAIATTFYIWRASPTVAALTGKKLKQKLRRLRKANIQMLESLGFAPNPATDPRTLTEIENYFKLKTSPSSYEYDVLFILLEHSLQASVATLEWVEQKISAPDYGVNLRWHWDDWIRDLTKIISEHDYPISINKTISEDDPKTSPFVIFVRSLQSEIPEKFRLSTHGTVALASAMSRVGSVAGGTPFLDGMKMFAQLLEAVNDHDGEPVGRGSKTRVKRAGHKTRTDT